MISAQSRKANAIGDFMSFYMQNSKSDKNCYSALQKVFIEYMTNIILLNKYEDYNEFEMSKLDNLPSRYDSSNVISYLKLLISHKDFDIANEIFETYPIVPLSEKETADYERIKTKLNKK